MDLKLYEIRPKYINYLSLFAKHLFHNKQSKITKYNEITALSDWRGSWKDQME